MRGKEKEVEVGKQEKKEEREDRVRLAENTGRSDGNSTLPETIPRGRNVQTKAGQAALCQR